MCCGLREGAGMVGEDGTLVVPQDAEEIYSYKVALQEKTAQVLEYLKEIL